MGLNLGICQDAEKKAKKKVLISYLKGHLHVCIIINWFLCNEYFCIYLNFILF